MQVQLPFHVYLERYRYKHLTLYHALRDAMISGHLPFGTRLPSTRELANTYGLSRGLVTQVYDMLGAEGFTASHVGQGTFVAFHHEAKTEQVNELSNIRLSAWAHRLADAASDRPNRVEPGEDWKPPTINFGISPPDLTTFPSSDWNRAMYEAVRMFPSSAGVAEKTAQGNIALRSAIAQYLRRTRGIDADERDVAIVNGSMQAIVLLVQLLVDPGDLVVMEDPGFRGVRRAALAVGAEVWDAPVDELGIRIEDWSARMLFVTPSRQFPTGVVLSLERRQQLLRWANERGAVILEDDYDSEFRYRGRPIEPLRSLDGGKHVVYVGTFSNTLFPGLRIGYVVLPPWLRETFVEAQSLYEPRPASALQQQALAVFMNSGRYDRHLRRMRRLYAHRHHVCLEQVSAELSEWFEVVPSDSGLHVFAWWKGSHESFRSFQQACFSAGIYFPDISSYQRRPLGQGVLFGFARFTESELVDAIAKVAEVLQRADDPDVNGPRWFG